MLTVLWSKITNAAVLGGSIGGTVLALLAWLITCRYYYGEINVEFLVASYSSLAGNLTSLCAGGIIAVVITLLKPDSYDFSGTRSSMYFN